MPWVLVRSVGNLAEAELLIAHLRHAGIGAELRGASGARLGVSGHEVWIDARNEARASEVLRTLDDAVDGPPIVCPRCSESNPSNFEQCWSCGTTFPLA